MRSVAKEKKKTMSNNKVSRKSVINLLIDTNAFREINLSKSNLVKRLKRLQHDKKLIIHIPEIIIQEYSIAQESSTRKSLKQLGKAISEMLKLPVLSSFDSTLNDLKVKIKNEKKMILDFSKNHLQDWMNSSGAVFHPIKDHHGAKVMNDYFSGSHPYREIKCRIDIPDSFIWQVVKDISDKDSNLQVITPDKGMNKACKSRKITVYENLREFLSSEFITSVEFDSRADQAKRNIIQYLDKWGSLDDDFIEQISESLAEELYATSVKGDSILDDNKEGNIEYVESINDLKFDTSSIEYYSHGLFTIPFIAELDTKIESYVFKQEFNLLDESRMANVFIEDWNKHFYRVQENFDVIVNGLLEFNFSSNALEEEFLSVEAEG